MLTSTDPGNDGTDPTMTAQKPSSQAPWMQMHKKDQSQQQQQQHNHHPRLALAQQQQQHQHPISYPPPDPVAALQWLQGRLAGGKKLYRSEELYAERQREMVVRFVRFNIFPFEPDAVERTSRVCALIQQIGILPEPVCQEIHQQLFASDVSCAGAPLHSLSPHSAPPANPLALGTNSTNTDTNTNTNTEAPSSSSSTRNASSRRYSPKLSAPQWIDFLRGYYQARFELRVHHNKHLSTENYCLEIGEGLRVTTLLRKWNASGLEALVQSELDINHPVVVKCLQDFQKTMETKAPRKPKSGKGATTTTTTTTAAPEEQQSQQPPPATVADSVAATASNRSVEEVADAAAAATAAKPSYDRAWAREMLQALPVNGPLRVKKRDGSSMQIFHGIKADAQGRFKISGTAGREIWIPTVDELLAQYFVLAEGNNNNNNNNNNNIGEDSGDRPSKRRRGA